MNQRSGFDRPQALGIAGAAGSVVAFGASASNAGVTGEISKDDFTHPVSTPLDEIVETTAGKIRGFRRGEVHIFKGIPYGAATSGDAKFMPRRPRANKSRAR